MHGLSELMQSLRVTHYPDSWNEIYDAAMEEWKNNGCFYLEKDYIIKLHQKYNLFENRLNDMLKAAEKIKNKKSLVQFICLLNYAMVDREGARKTLGELSLPVAPDKEDPMAYDFAPLFGVLSTIDLTVASFMENGVPEKIILATLKGYEECLDAFFLRFGRPGFEMRYLQWIQLYIDADILRIGRLNFEMRRKFAANTYILKNTDDTIRVLMSDIRMHSSGMVFGSAGCEDEEGSYDADFKETEAYYEGYLVLENGLASKKRERFLKPQWSIALAPDDSVLNVHIPRGENLSHEECEQAYSKAKEIFEKCYPEFKYKAFCCFSWLMDAQLSNLLSANSNIVKFQNKYFKFPRRSEGKGIFSYVFVKPFEHIADLCENSGLERAVKKHYMDGKYIYEQGGVFLK